MNAQADADAIFIKLGMLTEERPYAVAYQSAEQIGELVHHTGLVACGEHWSGVVVETEDGDYTNAWITESQRPFDNSAEYLQVLRNGKVLDWAKAQEREMRELNAAQARP